MTKYLAVLPIEVNGRVYQHGETVELDAETAANYSHALRAVATEDEREAAHGGDE